jgi:hypothetical protein
LFARVVQTVHALLSQVVGPVINEDRIAEEGNALCSRNGHLQFILSLYEALFLTDFKIQQVNFIGSDDVCGLAVVTLSEDLSYVWNVGAIGCYFSVFGGIEHGDPIGVHDHDGVGVMVPDCKDAGVEPIQLDAKLGHS